jgi:hypothetical protein
MRAIFSERLRSSYENAPPHIQRAFDRRIALLLKIPDFQGVVRVLWRPASDE